MNVLQVQDIKNKTKNDKSSFKVLKQTYFDL